ncbi:MAG TPA: bifunctional serine/threonine-protein kinase/formylglycine-generating enzyme family protein [Solimonas sp.]|nr:bifunctional serine/threonine-protein kinase/formylglycine-generating enzyme family protein [Solimonas sp.]
MFQKHCPGCYGEKKGVAVCPFCGYDESEPRSPLFLPHGGIIGGQYRVGRVLGRPGGFGITYIGWEIHLQQRVAIKEYLPREQAGRQPPALEVKVHVPADHDAFEAGKEQFLREARIVARFDHPNVVRVRNFFKDNGTAYLVMDYYEGVSLGDYLVSVSPQLDAQSAVALLRPIIDALQFVHERGIVHRDVKPQNIYLASIGKPILLDFGAARQGAGVRPNSLSVVLTEGYAPLEQYQRRAPQGPHTDVYSVAATLYRMITGHAPPISLDRLGQDEGFGMDYANVPATLRPILERALAVRPQERYASAAQFRDDLDAWAAAAGGTAVAFPELPAAPARSAAAAISPQDETRIREEPTRPVPAVSRESIEPAPVQAGPVAPTVTATPALPPPAPPTDRRTAVALVAGMLVTLAAVAWLAFNQPVPVAPVPPAPPAASAGTAESGPALQPEMILLPGGHLEMGEGRARHPVEVAPFEIGSREVAVSDFSHFVARTGYRNPAWAAHPCEGAGEAAVEWDQPGHEQSPRHPVVCINLQDALAYARWLSRPGERQYRLPTEAEWEYAARAGQATAYWWGDDPARGGAVCANCGAGRPRGPAEVDSAAEHPYWLSHIAGNVREWTCSAWLPYGSGAEQRCGASPLDPFARAVVRGGSWRDTHEALRSDARLGFDVQQRNTWTGMRLAADAPRTNYGAVK